MTCLVGLRTMSAHEGRLQHLHLRLQAARVEAWRAFPPKAGRFLRFRLHGEDSSITCLADVDQWANTLFPELGGIAWSSMPAKQLFALASGLETPLNFSSTLLHYHSAALLDIVDIATADLAKGAAALACRAAEATVYLEDAPAGFRARRRAYIPPSLATVRMPVAFLCGRSVASAGLLRRLRVGDAMLIAQCMQIARYRSQDLFSFSMTEGGLIIEEIIMQDTQYTDPDPDADADGGGAEDGSEPSIDLGELRLSVEFVLSHKDYSLAELGSFEPGHIIELPADAAQRIDIVANRKLIASGELVQFDNRLAVQIRSLRKS